jgi:hypothetical protein
MSIKAICLNFITPPPGISKEFLTELSVSESSATAEPWFRLKTKLHHCVPVLDNWWLGTRTVIGYQSIREDNAITDGIK